MNNFYKNILIVRTDRIGDLILTLPVARIIKKTYPHSKVSFLVREYTKNILQDHPFIDEVLVLEERSNKIPFFSNIKKIKANKFDACVVVYPKFIVALILFFSGIKLRIGTGYRWYSFLFNKKVYEHRKYAEKHELEFNIALLKQLGIDEKINNRNVDYDLQVNYDSSKKINELLSTSKFRRDVPLIIVHPGSARSSIDLPIEKFRELIQKLVKEKFQVVITGNEQEVELCNTLIVSEEMINYAGIFNLEELMALISKSDMFISNSTGPLHIAAALGKFTVGFYPKIVSCSKERWAPYTIKKLIYEPEISCSNCTREQCEKLNCMNSINIEKVFQDIKNVFVNKKLETK